MCNRFYTMHFGWLVFSIDFGYFLTCHIADDIVHIYATAMQTTKRIFIALAMEFREIHVENSHT